MALNLLCCHFRQCNCLVAHFFLRRQTHTYVTRIVFIVPSLQGIYATFPNALISKRSRIWRSARTAKSRATGFRYERDAHGRGKTTHDHEAAFDQLLVWPNADSGEGAMRQLLHDETAGRRVLWWAARKGTPARRPRLPRMRQGGPGQEVHHGSSPGSRQVRSIADDFSLSRLPLTGP